MTPEQQRVLALARARRRRAQAQGNSPELQAGLDAASVPREQRQMATAPEGLVPGSPEYAQWAAEQARAGMTLPQVSAVPEQQSSILDPFVQGTTFGWGDEGRAFVQSQIARMQGYDPDVAYNQVLDESRNALERERRLNPLGSFAAELGGGIATTALAGRALAPIAGGIATGQGLTVAQRAAAGGVLGAGQGALYGAGSTEGDRGQGALTGGLVGGAVGLAAPVIGNAINQGINRGAQRTINQRAAANAPSSSEMQSAASTLFEQSTGGTPVALTDNAYFRFLGDVQQIASRFRINSNLDQRSVGLSQMLTEIADTLAQPGAVVDMKDLHIIRQAAQRVAQSGEGRDTAFASIVINRLDEFIKTLRPSDMAGGANPSQAANALMQGISTWSRANKVSLIEEAIYRAQNQASGVENGLRVQFRRLLQNPTTRNLFNSAELRAIEDVVNGTTGTNLMRLLGKFGFGGGSASNMLGGTIGFGAGLMTPLGPVGGMLAAGVGTAARRGAEVMTERAANRALGAAATPGLRVLPPINSRVPSTLEQLIRLPAGSAGGMASP